MPDLKSGSRILRVELVELRPSFPCAIIPLIHSDGLRASLVAAHHRAWTAIPGLTPRHASDVTESGGGELSFL